MLKDVLPYIYMAGFALALLGEVRTAAGLSAHGADITKTNPGNFRFSTGALIGLFIGGFIQFVWWVPLVSVAVSMVFGALANAVDPHELAFRLNKGMFVLGTVLAAFACIANQA